MSKASIRAPLCGRRRLLHDAMSGHAFQICQSTAGCTSLDARFTAHYRSNWSVSPLLRNFRCPT